jgi:hypothetical protein
VKKILEAKIISLLSQFKIILHSTLNFLVVGHLNFKYDLPMFYYRQVERLLHIVWQMRQKFHVLLT